MINTRQLLFQYIADRSNTHKNWREDVQTLMQWSRATTYKKINGETNLSADEWIRLVTHYQIDPYELLPPPTPTRVCFDAPFLQQPVRNAYDYLYRLAAYFEPFSHDALPSQPVPRVFYATREVPLLYYCGYPALLLFKLYSFSVTTWGIKGWKNRYFDLKDAETLYKEEIRLGKLLHEYYKKFDTVEFWNSQICEFTFNQLNYMLSAKQFKNPDDARLILSDLLLMMQDVAQMTEKGFKIPSEQIGKLSLNVNDISHINNTVLITHEGRAKAFVTFDNPNFLTTEDKPLIEYIKAWMERMTHTSVPICKVGYKQREKFFGSVMGAIRTQLQGAGG